VGLGPSTVVRLEGALAHEVLRYCTAIRGICAEGGAGYWVGRGLLYQQTRACENSPPTGLLQRYGSQWATVKLVWFYLVAGPPKRTKTAYGGAAGLSLSGDTPMNCRFCEHEHYELDLHTAPP